MTFGIIGSGTWATALAKILSDNSNVINWWFRDKDTIKAFETRGSHPRSLSSVHFNLKLLNMSDDIKKVVSQSDVIILAVPSAYFEQTMKSLSKRDFAYKKIVSAIKGIAPSNYLLINKYLETNFNVDVLNYFTILGPCHAEEIAREKLSYLTLSGYDVSTTSRIAKHFNTRYTNTSINTDIIGVQYAAVLKNVYALGAGIAHGLGYGDNFLSVYIANCSEEMNHFLKKIFSTNEYLPEYQSEFKHYSTSVYLGDLLVTCYSLYSRNRTFGNMLGKGYSVKSAQLEMNMIAEGYNGAKCIKFVNDKIQAEMPLANIIYNILWKKANVREEFKKIENSLK